MLGVALAAAPSPDRDPPELQIITVLSLDGSCRTSILARSPGVRLRLLLPANATEVLAQGPHQSRRSLRRVGRGVEIRKRRGEALQLTFAHRIGPFGLRGRYRLVLPRLESPFRGVRWEIVLPRGIEVEETQSSLEALNRCRGVDARGGRCIALFQREQPAGALWVEGAFRQRLHPG